MPRVEDTSQVREGKEEGEVITVEINIMCDNDNCNEIEVTEPDYPVNIESAYELAASHGWLVEMVDGHLKAYCQECAKARRKAK